MSKARTDLICGAVVTKHNGTVNSKHALFVTIFLWGGMGMDAPPQALEEALNLHSPNSAQQPFFGNQAEGASNLRRQDLLTQITVLTEQVFMTRADLVFSQLPFDIHAA